MIFSPFAKSRADLIIYLRLRPITVPEPIVHGPPRRKTRRGGTGAAVARATATLMAWPVAREFLSFTVMV